MMFAQRFTHIFFPSFMRANAHRSMKDRLKTALFRTLDDTRRLIFVTGVVSAGTQLWAPFLMREVEVYGASGGVEGSYCGPDSTVVNKDLFKWIAALESIWTYAIPFSITLLTDVAVLALTNERGKAKRSFATVSAEQLSTAGSSTRGKKKEEAFGTKNGVGAVR